MLLTGTSSRSRPSHSRSAQQKVRNANYFKINSISQNFNHPTAIKITLFFVVTKSKFITSSRSQSSWHSGLQEMSLLRGLLNSFLPWWSWSMIIDHHPHWDPYYQKRCHHDCDCHVDCIHNITISSNIPIAAESSSSDSLYTRSLRWLYLVGRPKKGSDFQYQWAQLVCVRYSGINIWKSFRIEEKNIQGFAFEKPCLTFLLQTHTRLAWKLNEKNWIIIETKNKNLKG